MILTPDGKKFDPQLASHCWLHANPDPKKLDKIKMKPWKTIDKNGQLTMGRTCPKCHNTVIVNEDDARANKVKVEAYSQNIETGDVQSV